MRENGGDGNAERWPYSRPASSRVRHRYKTFVRTNCAMLAPAGSSDKQCGLDHSSVAIGASQRSIRGAVDQRSSPNHPLRRHR